MRIILSVALVLLGLTTPVAAITVSQLPHLAGDVFAAELGGDNLVAIVTFDETVLGTYYTEYLYDPATGKLSQHATTIAQVLQSHTAWIVQKTETPDPQDPTYVHEPVQGLQINGLNTGVTKVDYSQPSAVVPVLSSVVPGGCVGVCQLQGCCGCCICVHRAIGVPEWLDFTCCTWLGNWCGW